MKYCFERLPGWFFIVIAIVVAVHTIIEPLYHNSSESQAYSIWEFINRSWLLELFWGLD